MQPSYGVSTVASYPELCPLRILQNMSTMHALVKPGTLPEEMSILSNLYALSVCNNKLQGSLPDAYKALRHLEVLDVGANLLTGSVPSSWSSMRTITFAGFYNNTGMYGCLPRVWEQSGSFFRDAKRIATYVSAGTNITGLCS
jgi:hypothetical protein